MNLKELEGLSKRKLVAWFMEAKASDLIKVLEQEGLKASKMFKAELRATIFDLMEARESRETTKAKPLRLYYKTTNIIYITGMGTPRVALVDNTALMSRARLRYILQGNLDSLETYSYINVNYEIRALQSQEQLDEICTRLNIPSEDREHYFKWALDGH